MTRCSTHPCLRSVIGLIVFISLTSVLTSCGGSGGGSSSSGSTNNFKEPETIFSTWTTGMSAMAVADINQDGFDDLIGARSTGLISGSSADLILLINDGMGGVSDETSSFIDGPVPKFFWPRDVHVADFNNDGRPDVFFSNQGKELATGIPTWPCEQNTLLLSQPNGQLKDVTSTNLPNIADFSHGSSIADIDGDSDIDIWVNNLGCGATVPGYLLQNDGNGMFTDIAGLDHKNGILPLGFSSAFWTQFVDVNADGAGDLFYTNLADNSLLMNDGGGVFLEADEALIPDAIGTVTTQHSEVVDLNNDGFDDIILFQTPDTYGPGSSLQILISNGTNGFVDETNSRLPPQNSNSGGFPRFWIGDINGDGHTDIMVHLYDPSFDPDKDITDFYLNDGTGIFTEMSGNELPPIRPDYAPIDINNDGKLDFIFPKWLSSAGASLLMTIAK